MLDLSVIILSYNEEIHIRRCIENVYPIAREIFVIDSYSTDATLDIANEFKNVHILQNKWENNYAKQFNWALQNVSINTKWVLRLDADEYLTEALIGELRKKLNFIPENITGIVFNRRHIFLGKWMRNGVYPVRLLRLFQYKKGVCEQRLMDEHIVLKEGDYLRFENDFVDENLNNLSWWSQKHVGYAVREAVDLLDIELDLGISKNSIDTSLNEQALRKRVAKLKYATQPLFLRSFLYFCYRYFFKLGFLDGKEGFLWHFMQGWWYRTLVDAKIFEIKKHCGSDVELIKKYLLENYNIYLD